MRRLGFTVMTWAGLGAMGLPSLGVDLSAKSKVEATISPTTIPAPTTASALSTNAAPPDGGKNFRASSSTSLPSHGTNAAPVAREWTRAELLPYVVTLPPGRNFAVGRTVFEEAMCGRCHAMGQISQGNGYSPDLTGVGSKYTRDVILDSILQPSAVISGQYYATEFHLKNGEVLTGTLVDQVGEKYVIAASPLALDETVKVAKAEVVEEKPSARSPMPEGLLNAFTAEQIRDLFAFLEAQGDPEAAIFVAPTRSPPPSPH